MKIILNNEKLMQLDGKLKPQFRWPLYGHNTLKSDQFAASHVLHRSLAHKSSAQHG